MSIELMMLQVLDDPTGVRIIVETCYPDFGNVIGGAVAEYAYFMIDHGVCGMTMLDEEADEPMTDENGETIIEGAEVYDYWQVSDSLGQSHKFNSNVELLEFIQSIESITTKMWVESF